jgi:alkylated DNA repair dioxygenase AlkB
MPARSSHEQPSLFDDERDARSAAALPDGFTYRPGFLAVHEESSLLAAVGTLPIEEARYREFTARRRIASFGASYDFTANRPLPAPPLPDFLEPLRARLADLADLPADELVQCTVVEYRPGTQLGWHRDVPTFGIVMGVSLASPARMRLRPYPHRVNDPASPRALTLDLAPRSAYVIRDAARWGWQHAISPTKALRWSITFRTIRRA